MSVGDLVAGSPVELRMVESRGTKIYPSPGAMTDTVDHYRCRLMQRAADGDLIEAQVLDVISRVGAKHRRMHVEKLNEFDGAAGFTKVQGERSNVKGFVPFRIPRMANVWLDK